jgi:hypothetical protein
MQLDTHWGFLVYLWYVRPYIWLLTFRSDRLSTCMTLRGCCRFPSDSVNHLREYTVWKPRRIHRQAHGTWSAQVHKHGEWSVTTTKISARDQIYDDDRIYSDAKKKAHNLLNRYLSKLSVWLPRQSRFANNVLPFEFVSIYDLRFSRWWLKNAVFWDLTPRGAYKNRRFARTCRHRQQGGKNLSMIRLLVTANFVPSSSIFVTLMMEEILFSEIYVLTRATRRNFPEDSIVS